MTATLAQEIGRRRTFAIISHPDAGKTTLTEKLLLYGGAIRAAGSVKSRRSDRHATSDWLDMEQERGISITASVLHFDYEGFRINLLDTPGHQDFSEDTYRTLTAAAQHPVQLTQDAAKAGFEVTRQVAGSLFSVLGDMMNKAADAMKCDSPPPAPAPESPEDGPKEA